MKLRDIILIRTRGDLANSEGLIRREMPDARLFARDIQRYFGLGQSLSMQRPNEGRRDGGAAPRAHTQPAGDAQEHVLPRRGL